MKKGRVIEKGTRTISQCPHCKKQTTMGVWAIVHLRDGLVVTCKCGKKYSLTARGN